MNTTRLATPSDANAIQAIYAPIVRQTTISFEVEAPSVDEMRGRIAATLVQYPWLVAQDGGSVLGYAYASPHRERAAYQWSVDVSVYVAESARRRGVARGLYVALLGILEDLGYYTAYAGIALPNPASVAFHETLGFRPIGVYHNVGYKLGAWHDVGWWQLALRDYGPGPMPPLKMADYVDSPHLQSRLSGGQLGT